MLPPLPPMLNLTDAQRDQMKSLADSHRDEWKALGDRDRAVHEAVHTAEMADPVDDNLIRAKVAEAAAVEADMAVARAHTRVEVFQILADDQKAQLKQMEGRMKGRGPRQ